VFKKVISLVMISLLAGTLVAYTSPTKASESGSAEDESKVKWPETMGIVVATEAAGNTDFNARILAEKLAQKLETKFVISNIPDNAGVTATHLVKDAANDGSKVLFFHSAFAVNQLSGATDYGLDAYEFAGITAMSPGNVLVVSSDLSINSLEELIAYSQENPGQLDMAVEIGATSQAVALLLKSIGLDVNIIGAAGAGDRLASLVGGSVDVTLAPYGDAEAYIRSGMLVPLALDGLNNLEEVNLKSITNLGHDIGFPFYYFFAFPKGTDQALVQEFSNALKEIIEEDQHYAETIYRAYYQSPVYFSPEEGLEKIEEVYATLGKANFSQNMN